jgi:hypothetical protein
VSWWPVIALCAGAYALKALGLAIGGRLDAGVVERYGLERLTVPLLAALIAVQTFATGHRLTLGRRRCWSPGCWSGAGRRWWWWRSPRPRPPRCCGCSSNAARWGFALHARAIGAHWAGRPGPAVAWAISHGIREISPERSAAVAAGGSHRWCMKSPTSARQPRA